MFLYNFQMFIVDIYVNAFPYFYFDITHAWKLIYVHYSHLFSNPNTMGEFWISYMWKVIIISSEFLKKKQYL